MAEPTPAEQTGGRDRGTVTVEVAVALPALALLLAVALGAVEAGATQVACVDSARLGARSLARGDSPQVARELIRQTAPESSTMVLEVQAEHARVTVSAPVRLAPLPTGLRVTGRAVTPAEPGS
ncbi:TadE family type IV pilus minor pilin [Lipingzhangella sp. LS1_29]|uniref:TadE family type IV pilus minor pilin n=1 Tax=Lipingzhangella rawalii TaxID=2055835 RepID=A0ABU2H4U8_9ACTN|nr:TadE family type IV pilus minor pilin [Lipingzhangella rawalii]MDS1270017.1 TadE family type IV pilus minor pilin [Lipingzhangella rawalii]